VPLGAGSSCLASSTMAASSSDLSPGTGAGWMAAGFLASACSSRMRSFSSVSWWAWCSVARTGSLLQHSMPFLWMITSSPVAFSEAMLFSSADTVLRRLGTSFSRAPALTITFAECTSPGNMLSKKALRAADERYCSGMRSTMTV